MELQGVRELLEEKYKDSNKKRLAHIYGVAEMSVLLAKRYGIDPVKAEVAALMHDYCKYDDFNEIEAYLTEDEIKECREYNFLYHAFGSAYVYKELVGNDQDIFNAIYNHVFGRPGMSMLEAIIMIADYTEKNRTYPNCIECREILLSGKFNEAIAYSIGKTIELVETEGLKPHPRQILAYNEYKEKKTMTLEEVLLDDLAKIKAEDVLVYDMEGRSPFYSKAVICTVAAARQATAAISYIEDDCAKNGYKVRAVEGAETSWVLADCYDVIVHIFTKEEREHFALEKLFMDVPFKKIEL